jgi:uncharacterized membrane protein YfcA
MMPVVADWLALIDLRPLPAALLFGAAVLGGLVRGFSGFGAAMVMMPVLIAVLGPLAAVPTLSVMDSILTMPMAVRAARHCHWRPVIALVVGSMVAIPLGIWALIILDPMLIRWIVSGFVLLAVILLASGWRYSKPVSLPSTAIIGGAAGFCGGLISLAGPIIVIFWLAGQINASRTRNNILTYFGFTGIISFLAYLAGDLMSARVWILILMLAPVYGVSLYLGARLFKFASEQTYRRLALGLISLVAISSLVL